MVKSRKKSERELFQLSKVAIKNQRIKRDLLDKFYNKYLKDRQIRINQIQSKQCGVEEITELYMTKMECQFAEQQWGIFLKKKIPEKQLGKQQLLSINFDDFVKEYHSNRGRNDVNPGYFAIYGSRLLKVNAKQSETLFDQALTKNKDSWVNQYYKIYFRLKQLEGSQLSEPAVQDLIKSIKQVCQIIIVEFSLEMAMKSNIKLCAKQQSEYDLLQTFYIDIMSYLHDIAETMNTYVIKQKKRMKLRCNMKDNNKNLPSISAKGLNHLLSQFCMEQIVQKKKKKGFFGAIWSGIKAVFLTVCSAVATIGAVVASPFVALAGGNVKEMWGNVGKMWKKTGEQWKNFLPALPVIAAVGFGLLAVYVSGWFAIPAAASLIAWLFIPEGEKLVSVARNNVKGEVQSHKCLVQIKGFGELNLDAIRKMQAFRAKLEIKKTEKSTMFSQIYESLEEAKINLNPAKMKKVEKSVFSKFGDNKDNKKQAADKIGEDQLSNQEKIIKKSAILKIIQNSKTVQKLKNELKVLETKHQSVQVSINNAGNQLLNNVNRKMTENVNKSASNLNDKQAKGTLLQDEVNKHNKNMSEDNQEFRKLQIDLQQNLNHNLTISKMSQMHHFMELSETHKFNFVDKNIVAQEAQKLQNSVRQSVQIREQHNEIVEIISTQKIFDLPLKSSKSQIHNPIALECASQIREQYVEYLKSQMQQKQREVILQLQSNLQEQIQEIQKKVISELSSINKIIRETPIHNPDNINHYLYFEEIVKRKCQFQTIQYFQSKQLNSFVQALKINDSEQIIVYNNIVAYKSKGQQKVLIKIYEDRKVQHQQLIKQIKRHQVSIVIIQADDNGIKDCGRSIVSDVQKFVFEEEIEQHSPRLDDLDVQKEYLKALIIKAIQILLAGQDYAELSSKRRQDQAEKKPFLPSFMMPFELGVRSEEFKIFGRKINDLICQQIFSNETDLRMNRQLVENVRSQMAAIQTELIRQKYPDFRQCIESERKRPSRR